MGKRLDLHAILVDILGSSNVYFQPPSTVKMAYPCIVYSLSDKKTTYADDKPYQLTNRYTAIVIDRNPDSEIPDKLAALPMCKFDRPYTSDNLNHWAFNIYY